MPAYCHKNGIYYSGSGGCPRCEEQAHQDELIELQEQLDDAAAERAMWSDYLRDNPGDYECPHCKYKTIKLGATRCPKCQGTLDQKQQEEIAAVAARDAKRREREIARIQREAQERQRICAEEETARRKQAKGEQAAASRRRVRTLIFFVCCIISSLLTQFLLQSNSLVLWPYVFVPLAGWLSYYVSNPPVYKNLNRALVAAALVALSIPLWWHADVYSAAIQPIKTSVGFPHTHEMFGSPAFEVVGIGVILFGFLIGHYVPALVVLVGLLILRIVLGFS